jgi:sigma-E factor negative regulatory protein RseA
MASSSRLDSAELTSLDWQQVLSLLADDELAPDALGAAACAKLAQAPAADVLSTWQAHQITRAVLQGQAADQNAVQDARLFARIRDQLRQESLPQREVELAPILPPVAAKPVVVSAPVASNDSRWRLVASFAGLAAVGGVIFSVLQTQRADQAQLALTQARDQSRASQIAVPVLVQADGSKAAAQPVLVAGEQQVMLRDPRMAELLAQHRQFGAGALHAPSGFLRNATFDAAGRCVAAPGQVC